MTAKYEFIIIGQFSEKQPDWKLFLELAQDLISKYVGSLATVMLLNIRNNTETYHSITDNNFANLMLQNDDLLCLYPDIGKGCVAYSRGDHTWNFSISLPITNPSLDDEKAAEILSELWINLQPLNPKFAMAGEELSISTEEEQSILTGEITPLDLDLCDMAINATSTADTNNQMLVRKRLFFALHKSPDIS